MKIKYINYLLVVLLARSLSAEQVNGVPDWYRSPFQRNIEITRDIAPKMPLKERKLYLERWNKIYEQYTSEIQFHGLILDQENRPVKEAIVKILVLDDSERGQTEYKMDSDSQGRFELEGVHGKCLQIGIYHSEYYMSRKNQYSIEMRDVRDEDYYKDSKEKPIVFRAYKRGIAEPLIVNGLKTKISRDGREYVVNLFSGSVREVARENIAGDFLISFKKDDSSWGKLKITGIKEGDGFKIGTDEFMFSAPKEGYLKEIEIERKHFKHNVFPTKNVYLFVKSRDGSVYSRIRIGSQFHFPEPVETMPLEIVYFVNPLGSPNLEYEYGNIITPRLGLGGKISLEYPSKEQLKLFRKEGAENKESDIVELWRDFFSD